MSAAQILRQAEELKAAVKDTSRGANEAWVSRQNLQDLYQKLLVLDLEYALDKKVEQDLWNHAFKNQINTLQTQSKDKQNPKRPEILASLHLFLETGSGFYLQLLEELCAAFKLDLPCRRKSAAFGILKEYGPVANKIKAPKKSSCMYICQHCLVHLGDIARYREQMDQAYTYYKHAAHLVPYNGQPYNQLAILEAAKGNKLSTVVYYVRSIAVKHPFPVACTNLEKFYTKITKEIPETGRKLSLSEMTIAFLQFNALVHLSIKLDIAKTLSVKIVSSLPSHVTSISFSSQQLVQMITVLLFTLYHAKRKLSTADEPDDSKGEVTGLDEELGEEEQKGYELGFSLAACFLELLLSVTPVKQEAKAKEYHTLSAVKIMLDWLRTDSDLINSSHFRNPSICQNLSKLLNVLQFNTNQKDVPIDLDKYGSVPLPEDCDLRCFIPLQSSHSDLHFNLMPVEGLSPEVEMRLRCQRLVEHGLWLCEEFPSLNLINVQKQKSGRLHFSAPNSQVRIMAGTDSDSSTEKKSSYRQNVAIQAIMQHKAKKENITILSAESKENVSIPTPAVIPSNQGNQGPAGKVHGKTSKKSQHGEKLPQKTDAGLMVNTSTETQEPQEKPIPSDAWEQATPLPQPPNPHIQPPPNPHPNTLKQTDPQHRFSEWSVAEGQNTLFGNARVRQEAPVPGVWPTPKHQQPAFPGQRKTTPDIQQNKISEQAIRDGRFPMQPGNIPKSSADRHSGANDLDPMGYGMVRKDGMQGIIGGQAPFYHAMAGAAGNPKPENETQFNLRTAEHEKPQPELSQKQYMQLIQTQGSKQAGHQTPSEAQVLAQLQQQWVQQYQQQQQQKTDNHFHQEIQHLDKRIMQTSEQLKQVSQQIQQRKQAVQHDKEIQVMQQQLQQMKLQQKQLADMRQQQQLQQIISQHEAKLLQKYQQIQEILAREINTQQQLQQQQQQLLQQRQQMLDSHTKQQQLQQRRPSNPDKLAGFDQWPAVPPNMDLGQLLAVLDANKKSVQGSTWEGQGHFSHENREDVPATRPNSLPQGSGNITGTSGKQNPKLAFGFADNDLKSPEADFQRYPYSPMQPSQLETTTTQSYLENIFQGRQDFLQEQSPGGAFIPTSDSEEEMRQVGEKLSKMSPFGLESVSDLTSSTGLVLDLSRLAEEIQSNSPPVTTGGTMFAPSSEERNTYSLFSQSPWTVQLTTAETKSHTSSPFGSSTSTSSSLRTTPDPHPPQEDRLTPVGSLGSGLNVGYSRPPPPVTSEAGWGPGPVKQGPSVEENTTSANVVLPNKMQSIWNAGPSPLQKLLQQQKNQRQNDPH